MSWPADDLVRVKELSRQGLSDCAISRYTGVNRGSIAAILGKRKGQRWKVVSDDRLSTRQRVKLINQLGASSRQTEGAEMKIGDTFIYHPDPSDIGTGFRTTRWYWRFHHRLRYPFWKWFPMPLYGGPQTMTVEQICDGSDSVEQGINEK